jgi:hypothetical protein
VTTKVIIFHCPSCKVVVEAREWQAGEKMRCPKCNEEISVPLPLLHRKRLVVIAAAIVTLVLLPVLANVISYHLTKDKPMVPPSNNPEGERGKHDEENSFSFTEVQIEKPFDVYLRAHPLFMGTAGAKIIRIDDRRQLVLAVASIVLKNNSSEERLRAELVCRTKADAYILQQRQEVQIAHVVRVKERVTVVLDRPEQETEVLEETLKQVRGVVRVLPIIGRWKSRDGSTLYLAIGSICDMKGNPMSE